MTMIAEGLSSKEHLIPLDAIIGAFDTGVQNYLLGVTEYFGLGYDDDDNDSYVVRVTIRGIAFSVRGPLTGSVKDNDYWFETMDRPCFPEELKAYKGVIEDYVRQVMNKHGEPASIEWL